MKQKMFLTSALAMGFVAPAMAITDSNSFPDASQGEYMQVDTRYINAATSTNMAGVYEGTVDAVAQYTDVLYQIAAGQYLPADSETVINCNQPGYFCPGVSGDVYYDENNNQGLTSCSTVGDGSYTSSDGTGSTADTCYRQCSGNVTFAHATEVSGNDYYGNGADTCEPTGCVNGWHLKSGISGSELATAIGNGAGENSAYVNGFSSFSEMNYDGQGAKGASYYGLSTSNPNTWAVDYGTNGMLVGQGRCSTQQGYRDTVNNNDDSYNNPTTFASLTDETGQTGAKYCYCNVTGYTPDGGTLQAVLSPWMFYNAYVAAQNCAHHCAYDCAGRMRDTGSSNLAHRAALLGSVQPGLAMCEANTITINWGDTDIEDVTANNAGTATYDSDIRTPVKAQHKSGKRFTGWRFSAPEQTNLPD